MAADHKVTFMFKGGAVVTVPATDAEQVKIAQIWQDHLGGKSIAMSLGYAAGQGGLRLSLAEIADLFIEKT